jgi:hypothetical protein
MIMLLYVIMSEQLSNRLHLTAAALAAAGAMLLTGCTSGDKLPEHPAVVALPGDSLPLVSDYADTAPLDGYGNSIDMGDVTTSFQNDPAAPAYEYYEDIDPIAKKVTDATELNYPLKESAPLLDIMAGSDGKLHFKDYSPVQVTQGERQLLAAVQSDEIYLSAAMRAKRLDAVRFRLNQEQSPESDAIGIDTSYPIATPQDVHDGTVKSNIYYFLPGHGNIDTDSIGTMLAHENTHSSLRHGVYDLAKSTAEKPVFADIYSLTERTAFEGICADLRTAVADDVSLYGWESMSDFDDLATHQAPKYHGVMSKVYNAINSGDYDKLPVEKPDDTTVSTCRMEHPVRIAAELGEKRGINMNNFYKVGGQDTDDGSNSRAGEVADAWFDALEQETILADFTESQFLTPSDENADHGHLQDGSDETEASVASTVLTKTDEVAQKIAAEPADRQQLELRLVDATIGQLKTTYANDPAFIDLANKKLQVIHAAVPQ